MKTRLLILFLSIAFTHSLSSQQIFPENISSITRGLKKIIYSTKGIDSEEWRTEKITYYDDKGKKIKEEQYNYDNEYENGFYIAPRTYTYKNNKLFNIERTEYELATRNDLYYVDPLKKTILNTRYLYNKLSLLDSIKYEDPNGLCASVYTYKNNKPAQVDSICSIGCCCEGFRKQILYNDKALISSVTIITGIVNSQCEPSNYISPLQFNQLFYNEKNQLVKEKIKTLNVAKSASDSLTYNYTYGNSGITSILLVQSTNEYLGNTIAKVIYTYDSMQRLTGISIGQTGARKEEELKYEFVY
jgi:hypothetical protein